MKTSIPIIFFLTLLSFSHQKSLASSVPSEFSTPDTIVSTIPSAILKENINNGTWRFKMNHFFSDKKNGEHSPPKIEKGIAIWPIEAIKGQSDNPSNPFVLELEEVIDGFSFVLFMPLPVDYEIEILTNENSSPLRFQEKLLDESGRINYGTWEDFWSRVEEISTGEISGNKLILISGDKVQDGAFILYLMIPDQVEILRVLGIENVNNALDRAEEQVLFTYDRGGQKVQFNLANVFGPIKGMSPLYFAYGFLENFSQKLNERISPKGIQVKMEVPSEVYLCGPDRLDSLVTILPKNSRGWVKNLLTPFEYFGKLFKNIQN